MIIRELITKFGFQVDDAKLEKLGKNIKEAKDGLGKMGEKASAVGRTLTAAVTLPVVGLGAAFVKAASDAEEAESKFNTVFGGIQKEANNTAKALSRDFGQSASKAFELLGDTGDILTGFGFAQKDALELSKSVNELAVDLASFTNFSGGAEGASKALTKALIGERESVKSLGIAILETDVKAKVAALAAEGRTFETERQAKAYATLQIALEQSKNAQGDYARTNKQFANQTRNLTNALSDMAVAFGKILLPIATKAVAALIKMARYFEDLDDSTKKIILVFAGLAAVLGPILLTFGAIVAVIPSMITGFLALKSGIMAVGAALTTMKAKMLLSMQLGAALEGSMLRHFAKMALAALPWILALGAIYLLFEDLYAFATGGDSVIGSGMKWLVDKARELNKSFEELPGIIRGGLAILLTPIRAIGALVNGIAEIFAALAAGEWKSALTAIPDIFKNTFDMETAMKGGIGGLFGFGADVGTEAYENQMKREETINATANITVEVGEANEEQLNEAAEKVKRGVNFGLSDMINAAKRDVATPIAE